jgi:hypothetical protein
LVPEFEEACKVSKEAAYTAFLDGFVYDGTNQTETRKSILRLEAACQTEIDRLLKKNRDSSLKQCMAILDSMQEAVKESSKERLRNMDDDEG